MDTPHRDLISRLFHAALERPPDERRAFVAQACAGDDALQHEIESLLRYHSNASGFLETPAVVIETNVPSEPAGIVGRQLGPYQIVALLGSGGMGEVYRARDRKLGRDVAIKVLHPRFTADRERRARFSREARLLATLSHPHIGAIYGLEESDGLSALVLELVEGPTLADRLANGPLPIVEALTIARQIADALQAAHEKGIVHRDLKPSNVVVQRTVSATAETLRVRVVDFGLGKLISTSMDEADEASAMSNTADGRRMGTPAYMSPEQTRGHAVDKRMDIWAFGAILFEMLTGRRAFEGATVADTFASILEHEPDWSLLPPNTPASIRRLLERCLQKDVRRRFRDMADAVFELDDALGGSAGVVNIGTGSATVRRRGWTRKRTLGLAAALGVAFVAVAAFVWTTRRTTDEPMLVRLTSNPSGMSVTSAHISPDGRHLAFADPTGVQVRSIDGGRVHRFSDTQGMDVYGWTPDSAGVLASRCDNLACVGWAIALVGQDRQRTGAVWSRPERVLVAPDGKRLLRWNYATAKSFLAVDPLNGSPAREVATGDVFMPTWSADGKRVVYIRSENQTIESVSAEGGTAIEVFRAPEGQVMRSVIELPDRTILISMMPSRPSIARPSGLIPGTPGQSGLWRVYPDRTGVVRNPPRRLTANGANATDLTASSTGRVAFLDIRNQSDVYVADGDVRGGSVNVPRRFTLSDSDNLAYTWTPDSAAVLFSSNRHGSWDIFKQRLESDIAEPFFSGPRHEGYPGITSDGRWVLYADGTSEDDNIMRASLSGGAPAEVVPLVGRGRLQCAAHGRCVLLEVKDRSFWISSLHPLEGKGRELARIPATNGFRLLPDGDTFAYILPTENGIRNRVRLLSFVGKPDTDIVVKDAAALVGLGWLPSSAGFLTTDRGKLLLVFPNGTAKVLWAPTGLTSIDWAVPSPDERHLVINVSTRQSNAWMVSGF